MKKRKKCKEWKIKKNSKIYLEGMFNDENLTIKNKEMKSRRSTKYVLVPVLEWLNIARLGHVLSLSRHGSGSQDLDTSCPCLGMVLDGKAWTRLVLIINAAS